MDKKIHDENTVNAEADYFILKRYEEMEDETLLHWYKNHKLSDFLQSFAQNVLDGTLFMDRPFVSFLYIEKFKESRSAKEIVFYFADRNYNNDGILTIPLYAIDFEGDEISINMFDVLKANMKRERTSIKYSEKRMMNSLFWNTDEKCQKFLKKYSALLLKDREKRDFEQYRELKERFEGDLSAA